MENSKRLIEWDENKNRLNKIKHGVDFNQAAKVFEDNFRLEERVKYLCQSLEL